MARAKGIVFALVAAQVAREAAELLDGAEFVTPPRNQLVRVGLVADIPDEDVVRGIEGDVEREGQLNGPQIRSKVSAAERHRFDDLLAHLLRQQGEVFGRKRLELRGLVNGVEYSCHESSLLQGRRGRYAPN